MHDYSQQVEAGQKSGLVRAASAKLADLLSNDIDSLLSDIAAGSIGGIKLESSTVQTILASAATSALETQIRSRSAMQEISLRHRYRLEVEQARHQNRLLERSARTGVSVETNPDCMTTSELMAHVGTQEEAQSTLPRPPADLTLGEWYEILSQKQRRIVRDWFDSEIDLNSASEMDARYVFDNMR